MPPQNSKKQEVGAFVQHMIAQGAPPEHIHAYVQSEGMSPVEFEQLMPREMRQQVRDIGGRTPLTGGASPIKQPPGPRITPAEIGAMAITSVVPGASIPKAALLAILGGAGGKGYEMAYNAIKGDDVPGTIPERGLAMGKAGGAEGIKELIGQGAIRGVGRAWRGVLPKKQLREGVDAVEELAAPHIKGEPFSTFSGKEPMLSRLLGSKRRFLLPAQSTEAKGLDVLENIGEHGFFAQRISKHKQWQKGMGRKIADAHMAEFGEVASPEQMGELLVEAITAKKSAFNKLMTGRYAQLDKVTKGASVDVTKMVAWAKSLAEEHAKDKGIGSTIAGEELIKKVAKLDGTISFKQAQRLRSKLIKLSSHIGTTSKNDPAIGITKKFSEMLNISIDAAGKELGGTAKDLFRQVNMQYKEGIAPFNRSVIRNLMHKPEVAEKAGKYLFRPDATVDIRTAKQLVPKSVWRKMEQAQYRTMLEKSLDPEKQYYVGTKLKDQLSRMGKPTLEAIHGKQGTDRIYRIADLLTLSQARQAEGAGRMMIQLRQPGEMVRVAQAVSGTAAVSGGQMIAAGGILLGPVEFGRWMTHPTGQKLLIEGITMPKLAPNAGAFMVRVTRFMDRMEREDQQDKPKPKGWPPLIHMGFK